MSDFTDQLDADMDNVFGNTDEFAGLVEIRDPDNNLVNQAAAFEFQVGAVDRTQRALFRIKDSITIERNYFITFRGTRWVVIDVRPDELGMNEVRCDAPDIIA